VITGGKGTLAGPVVGGAIFGAIPVIVRSFAAPEVQWILYGAFMMAIIFVLPQGIVPAIERLLSRGAPTPQRIASQSSGPAE
jgi:branched-chain amino acid transport system permease protein